jgi:hypothetical protein
MRAGDALLLTVIAVTLAGLVLDSATGGALGAWLGANLSTIGLTAGRAIGWIGLIASPLILLPLVGGCGDGSRICPAPSKRCFAAGR